MDGESTEKWAMREPGFFGTTKQLVCCARCGNFLKARGKKLKVIDLFKPSMHFICDTCFDALPD